MYLPFSWGSGWDYLTICVRITCYLWIIYELDFYYGWWNWKISVTSFIHFFCFLIFCLCDHQRDLLLSKFYFLFVHSTFPFSVILPCICTVFKESFVYVFAIKKRKCYQKQRKIVTVLFYEKLRPVAYSFTQQTNLEYLLLTRQSKQKRKETSSEHCVLMEKAVMSSVIKKSWRLS